MKYPYSQLIFSLFFLLFSSNRVYAEGFAAGTLIKVPDGYVKIKDLRIGDSVICLNAQKNYVESAVIYTTQKSVDRYVRIAIGDEKVCVACNQQLYDKKSSSWMIAQELCCDDGSAKYTINGELVGSPIDVYLIGVAEHHNFLVSKLDICTHNFFPPLVLAISLVFGSGSLEIAGVSAGIAGLGGLLGYQWHKKKQKHNFTITPLAFDVAQELDIVYHADDAQAPGMPTKKDGFYPPKKWDGKKVKSPHGPGYGWPDKKGAVWVPTGPNGHGCPHWDVEYPDGSYDNVVPGGRIRGKK